MASCCARESGSLEEKSEAWAVGKEARWLPPCEDKTFQGLPDEQLQETGKF